MTETFRPERSIADLFSQLTRETSMLFRQEVALAKAEMSDKLSQLGAGAAGLAVGVVLVFLSLQALLAAAVIGLAVAIGWWQSALVIGVFILLIGTAILIRGLARFRAENLSPRRTLASWRENTQWAKEQLR
jgi:hypothetical protein